MRGLPTWAWLMLAAASGLAATYVAMGWFHAGTPRVEKKAPVVVAALNLEPGAGLDGPALRVQHRDARPEGAFAHKEELSNFEAAAPIREGAPVLRSNIRPRSQGLAARVHAGKRAMTVKVDDITGLAGFPSPGNRVDVVLTTKQGDGGRGSRSETVLQNLTVLSHGASLEKKPGDKAHSVTNITLEVNPAEAERLALAVQEGQISLVLRSQEDQTKAVSTGVNLTQLMGATGMGVSDPAAAPPPPSSGPEGRRGTVHVIRKLEVYNDPVLDSPGPGPQGARPGGQAGGVTPRAPVTKGVQTLSRR